MRSRSRPGPALLPSVGKPPPSECLPGSPPSPGGGRAGGMNRKVVSDMSDLHDTAHFFLLQLHMNFGYINQTVGGSWLSHINN